MELLSGVKSRAKRLKLPYNISKEYITKLYYKQGRRCIFTNRIMTYSRQSPHDTNISVDRIVPKRGYVKGNIQLACSAVNKMRWNLPVSKFVKLCGTIYNHSKKEILCFG